MNKHLFKLAAGLSIVAMLGPGLALAETSGPDSQNGHGHSAIVRSHMITGTVAAVNGTSFTMTASGGTTYTVDDSSAKVMRKFGGASQTADIQVGDTVAVV